MEKGMVKIISLKNPEKYREIPQHLAIDTDRLRSAGWIIAPQVDPLIDIPPYEGVQNEEITNDYIIPQEVVKEKRAYKSRGTK